MIRYMLVCDRGHEFESWFRDAAAYEDQAGQGYLACVSCGSRSVGKAIMAPQIARKDRAIELAEQPSPPSHPMAAPASPDVAELRARIRELRQMLIENSENVGPRFAEEARRMHFGEAEWRSIHGQATLEDAQALLEEGIEAIPLPILPEERN